MLREKAINGIKWTGLSAAVNAGMQLLQVMILARMLSPNDFGLMAIATVLIMFSQIFLEMGITNAIIYHQDISKQELSSLFWFNIGMGWFIFLIVAISAPFVALFYHEPALTNIILWISISFLIQPFEQQFLALMRKELLFNDIARRDIFAKVISFIISVVLAYMGFGIYSLVYSYLAGVITATILIIIAGLKFHKPAFHFRFHEIKKFLSFGIYQTADSMVNYFNSQFDTIIIGKVLGINLLGIYNMAKNLSMRPAQVINPIITQVSYPLMAKVQHDESQVKAIYLRTIHYLSSCNFVIYLFMCVMAKPIIWICFGPKWDSAVLILQLLSIYAMIRSIINPIGTLLLTKGKVKQQFYWNLTLLAILPVTIYLGSLFGLTGVALASIFSIVGMLFAAWRFLVYPNCHATFTEFFSQLTGPILVGTCLVILLVLVNLIPIDNSILRLCIAGAVTAVVIMPLNKVFNNSYYLEIMRILASVRDRFKKKSI